MVSKMDFEKCLADGCLLLRKTVKGTAMMCVYIHDTLCVGDQVSIDNFKCDLNQNQKYM